VQLHAIELNVQRVTQPGAGAVAVDVAPHGVHWRNGPESIEYCRRSHISGVQDHVDVAQRLQRFRADEPVSISNESD
jgi:hypothetical protein